jgi:hypothetical protein
MMRPAAVLAAVLGAAACAGAHPVDSFDPPACPSLGGEFRPTDCALVQGRLLNVQGAPLPGVGVRVDSVLRPIGYAYTSPAETTDSQGNFYLTVLRINRFEPPTTPDTATVEIKLYHVPDPTPVSEPFAAVAVRMSFAPLGEPVEPTSAVLTLTPP